MELLWKIGIEKPHTYFKCGQFFANDGWRHKHMLLDKDFELMIEREVEKSSMVI